MRILKSVRAKLITANGHQHARRIIVSGTLCALLAACTTTKTVEVPMPVPVPGPTVYIPVPEQLLTCDDTGEPPKVGQPLGDLFAWAQRTRGAILVCRVNMAEIGRLASKPAPR
jgi:hypothetical protein